MVVAVPRGAMSPFCPLARGAGTHEVADDAPIMLDVELGTEPP